MPGRGKKLTPRKNSKKNSKKLDQNEKHSYATDETPELMPLTHVLATQLGFKLTEVRKNGTVPWLRPDGKTQVTCEYKKEGASRVSFFF